MRERCRWRHALALVLLLGLAFAISWWALFNGRLGDRPSHEKPRRESQLPEAGRIAAADLGEILEIATHVEPTTIPATKAIEGATIDIACPPTVPALFLPESYEVVDIDKRSKATCAASAGVAKFDFAAAQGFVWPMRLLVVAKGRFAAFFRPIRAAIAAPGSYQLEMPLLDGPWVYGRVLQENGLGAAGVHVNLMRHRVSGGTVEVFSTAHAVTESDGLFVLVRTGATAVHGPDMVGNGTLEASVFGDGFCKLAVTNIEVPTKGFVDCGILTLGAGRSITVQLVLDGQLFMREFKIVLGHGLVVSVRGQGRGGTFRFDGVPSLRVNGPSAWYYIDVTADPDGDGWENIVGRLVLKDLAEASGPLVVTLRDNAKARGD